jgi:hypothetical protein
LKLRDSRLPSGDIVIARIARMSASFTCNAGESCRVDSVRLPRQDYERNGSRAKCTQRAALVCKRAHTRTRMHADMHLHALCVWTRGQYAHKWERRRTHDQTRAGASMPTPSCRRPYHAYRPRRRRHMP